MHLSTRILATLALLTLAVAVHAAPRRDTAPRRSAGSLPEASAEAGKPVGLRYRITATNARLNRRPIGPVRRWVQGVPAEPVDSMCWNGVGSTPITGRFTLEIEPMRNTGYVFAEWSDENGKWSYSQTRFIHPEHHASGIRFGTSMFAIDQVLNEAVSHNVYLHGDTGQGMPVMPTVFAYLGAWGPAEVTLDGAIFRNPFEYPTPRWAGHLMLTEGVRRADGTVRTITNEIYNPSRGSEGVTEPGDLEMHLTFHDDLLPVTTNVPPPFSFFYHIVFEDVRIEIVQADGAAEKEPGPVFDVD
ncbi:MAG: hypothetical protein GY716_04965 [bacterium]|nr:hypothetical protein [bacterium]